MSIDWERFRFLCNVDNYENVWIYPTNNVAGDMQAMKAKFRLGYEFLPSCRLIAADKGHKPGIAIFFSQRLAEPLLNIGATIDRISDTILEEGRGTPEVAQRGKS